MCRARRAFRPASAPRTSARLIANARKGDTRAILTLGALDAKALRLEDNDQRVPVELVALGAEWTAPALDEVAVMRTEICARRRSLAQ